MNFNNIANKLSLLSIIQFVLVASVALATPIVVSAQTDDAVEKYGPNPELMTRDVVELELTGWKWQSELLQRQQDLVSEAKTKWVQSLEESRAHQADIHAELAAQGFSIPVDEQSVSKYDVEIRELKSRSIGLKAKLLQLKAVAKQEQLDLQYELQTRSAELGLHKSSINLLQQELDQAGVLVDKGYVTNDRLAELNVQLRTAENLMAAETMKQQQLADRLAVEETVALVATSEEYAAINSMLQDLQEKRKMLQSTRALQEIEMLRFQAGLALQMIEIAEVRKMELVLENIRYRALIELATEKLNARESQDK